MTLVMFFFSFKTMVIVCLFVLMLMLWLNRIVIVYGSTLRCRLDQNFFEDKKKYSDCKELFCVFIKHGLDGQF